MSAKPNTHQIGKQYTIQYTQYIQGLHQNFEMRGGLAHLNIPGTLPPPVTPLLSPIPSVEKLLRTVIEDANGGYTGTTIDRGPTEEL